MMSLGRRLSRLLMLLPVNGHHMRLPMGWLCRPLAVLSCLVFVSRRRASFVWMCRDCFWANRAFVFGVGIADARCLGMTEEQVFVFRRRLVYCVSPVRLVPLLRLWWSFACLRCCCDCSKSRFRAATPKRVPGYPRYGSHYSSYGCDLFFV